MKILQRAFTLVELLLGVTIFAVIAVCLYATFSSGFRLSEQSEKNNKTYREIRWVLELMTQDLENMVPYDFLRSYPDRKAFEGDKDKIVLLLAEEGGLKAIRYFLSQAKRDEVKKTIIGKTYKKNVNQTVSFKQEENKYYLIRESIPFLDYLEGISDDDNQEVLSKDIAPDGLGFSFAYLKEEEGSDIIWKDSWEQDYIPFGVHIEIKFVSLENNKEPFMVSRDVLVPAGFWGESESSKEESFGE